MLKSDLQHIFQGVHVSLVIYSTAPVVRYTELQVIFKGWLCLRYNGYNSSEHMKENQEKLRYSETINTFSLLQYPNLLEAHFKQSELLDSSTWQHHYLLCSLFFELSLHFHKILRQFYSKEYFGVTFPQKNNPKLFWIISYLSACSLQLIIMKGVDALNWYGFL